MKLAIYNGSPRGAAASSNILCQWTVKNSKNYENFEHKIYPLNKISQHNLFAEEMQTYDSFLFIFPLYIDSMPGIVKAFFEMAEQYKNQLKDKKVYFIIHSGFPERIHSRSLCRYLEYFTTKIMGMTFMGSAIIGFSEMVRNGPAKANHKKSEATNILLDLIINGKHMDDTIQVILGGKETYGRFTKILYRVFPFKDLMWKRQAKASGCVGSIYAKPYSWMD
jgi:multimeric flavodoxin WrbA